MVDHVEHGQLAVAAVEDLLAEAVDPLALVVHDLVVLEQVLAGLEVLLLDLLLRLLDLPGDHPALDRLPVLHAEARQESGHPLAAVDAHQVVLQRQEEPGGAGVALPAGPAAELVVDAPAVVPLGADDVQPAHADDLPALLLHLLGALDLLDGALPDVLGHVQARRVLVAQLRPGHGFRVAAEDDVGAAAGHVGGDGHRPPAAGLGDDLRLAGHVLRLGVEQLELDAAALEHAGEPLRLLDRRGADQDRLTGLVDGDDLLDNRLPLLRLVAVHEVRMVDAVQRLVGRDGEDVELVDLPELVGLRHGRAGHAGELLVELEEVLQRDRGEGLRLLLDLDAVAGVLGLDRLVQPVGPLPAEHRPAGELVDDDDRQLARVVAIRHDHVVLVALVEVVRLQGVVDEVRPLHVAGGVEALDAGQLLGLADALVGQVAGVLLLLDLVERAAALLL